MYGHANAMMNWMSWWNVYHEQDFMCWYETSTKFLIVHFPQEGYWASISSDSNGVAFHYCPPGYCRCARLEESDDPTCYSILPEDDIDKQCVCDRKGREDTPMMIY